MTAEPRTANSPARAGPLLANSCALPLGAGRSGSLPSKTINTPSKPIARLETSFQPCTSPASRKVKSEVKIGVVDHMTVSTPTGAYGAAAKNILPGIPTINNEMIQTCRCCRQVIASFLRWISTMDAMMQKASEKRTPDSNRGGACSTPILAATGNDPQTSTIAIKLSRMIRRGVDEVVCMQRKPLRYLCLPFRKLVYDIVVTSPGIPWRSPGREKPIWSPGPVILSETKNLYPTF